jgi:hypothetical protein
VVVDLAGVQASGEIIPILRSHDLDRIVGQGKATINASGIQIEGEITGDDGDAKQVVTHARNGFTDQSGQTPRPAVHPEGEIPTLAEWAGGRDKLRELTERFYEKVPTDPMLAPLFAGMDRVAKRAPIVGAVSINALKSWATRAYPDLWLIILGGLFILVVLFLPGGIVSIPARVKAIWQKFRSAPVDPTTPSSNTAPASASAKS